MKEFAKKIFIPILTFIENLLFKLCVFVIKQNAVPKHIALIVDGNRSFSKSSGVSLDDAYMKGVEAIIRQVSLTQPFGIKGISLFLFSVFNWDRKKSETEPILKAITALMKMSMANTYGCRYKLVGDISKLPPDFLALGKDLENKTKYNTGAVIQLAVNYGAKLEMVDSALAIFKHPSYLQNITEELIEDLMNVHGVEKTDIMIRTSGHKRYSDYFLWQNAYHPLFFTDEFWPEFSRWGLLRAVFYYQANIKKCLRAKAIARRNTFK